MSSLDARLLDLLKGGTLEQRTAAAIVIGEFSPDEPGVVEELVRAARSDNQTLRMKAVEALGKIPTPGAREGLFPFIEDSEEETVRDVAAHALARSGAQIVPVIRNAFGGASLAKRRTLLQILCLVRSKDAVAFLMSVLEEPNASTVHDAVAIFKRETAGLETKPRIALSSQVRAAMARKDFTRNRTAVDAGIQLLNHLRDPESAKVLLGYASPSHPADLRRNALTGLRWTLPNYKGRAAAVPALLTYLEEEDFPNVVSPSLEALMPLDVPESAAPTLINLARSRHPLVRKFVLSKMASLDREDVVLALIKALGDSDPMIRELASKSVEAQPSAWKVVVRELRNVSDAEMGWRMVRSVRAADTNVAPEVVKALAKDAIGRLESNDSLADPMLALVQMLRPDVHFNELYARGLYWKQKRRYAEAEKCLRPLTTSAHVTEDAQFELAIVALKNANATAGSITRDNDLPITLIRGLLKVPGFPLPKKLASQKRALEPEDFYYLGFHLVEGDDPERVLGSQLLHDIVRTTPRSKTGKNAKSKLRSEGLL